MKYKLVERANPQDRSKSKHYAQPINEGRVAQREIANDMVELSSLSRGDVSNVIESLIATVPRYLLLGKSVNLGDLGTFRLSFTSEGVETPAQFNTNLISGLKVIFTPSVELKSKIEKITFEKGE